MVEQAQSTPVILHYSCKKCRTVLFKPTDQLEHTSKVKEIKAPIKKQVKKQNLLDCTSYFLSLADWMGIPPDESIQQGLIYCPKCQDKLGSFAHFGTQCSCGCWVSPAY